MEEEGARKEERNERWKEGREDRIGGCWHGGRRGREEGSIGIIGWGKGSNYWDDGWPRGAAVALLSNQRSFRPSFASFFLSLSLFLLLSSPIVTYRLRFSRRAISRSNDPTKRKDLLLEDPKDRFRLVTKLVRLKKRSNYRVSIYIRIEEGRTIDLPSLISWSLPSLARLIRFAEGRGGATKRNCAVKGVSM